MGTRKQSGDHKHTHTHVPLTDGVQYKYVSVWESVYVWESASVCESASVWESVYVRNVGDNDYKCECVKVHYVW